MAAYISFQPSDYYSTKLYTATGSAAAITGVGFEPDLVWIKDRTLTGYPSLMNVLGGPTYNLFSNTTAAQANNSLLTAFDSDGYTLGGSNGDTNTSGRNYVSWNWKGGTTTGLSGGTLTPSSYSFNATSGFGIYAYTGTGSAATIPHGLGVAPEVLIVKRLDSTSAWSMYWKVLGANKYIYMNATAAAATDSSSEFWNNTDPTSTVFSVKDAAYTNGSTNTYVAYCFTPKSGYSKFGSYTGYDTSDGPFVFTGFRPAFVMIKSSGGVETWNMWDSKRSTSGSNLTNMNLHPDSSAAENTATAPGGQVIDILSNGFKIRGTTTETNQSGYTMIYMAFAEAPFVNSSSVPVNAR